MTEAEVEFVGGPFDGKKRAVQCEANGQPPNRLTIESLGSLVGGGDHTIAVETIMYLRRLNERDVGGLWEYVWVPPPGHDARLRAMLDHPSNG